MDPDAAWSELLTIANGLLDDSIREDESYSYAIQMAERLVELDEWLANGGFPPRSVYDRGQK